MRKVLLALFVVALFVAIYQVLTPILSSNPDFSSFVVRDVLVVSLLIATLAIIIAIIALMRASRIQKQTEDRLIAIDMALSDFANKADVAALSMADLARATHRDIVTMQRQMETGDAADEAGSQRNPDFGKPGKVVPLKAEKPSSPERTDEIASAGTIRQMIDLKEPRLSLQPIVDVMESKTIAFEAFASYTSDDQTIDIQRASELPDVAQLRLATALMEKSVQVSKRLAKSGSAEAQTVHVPLSQAFLAEGDMEAIVEAAGGIKGFPKDLTLSLPLQSVLAGPLPEPISGWRPSLACEADIFPDTLMQRLTEAEIRWLKLPAKTILSDGESERYSFICAPLGIDIIVTHVRDQDEAVALLDRGLRFMSGYHFGIPRPLRDEQGTGKDGSS